MGSEERRRKATHLEVLREQAGRTKILDRFGRQLLPGCKVVYTPPVGLVYTVVDIKPVLHPQAPAGLQTLILACQVELPAMDRLPQDLIIVTHYPEEHPLQQPVDIGKSESSAEAEEVPSGETAAEQASERGAGGELGGNQGASPRDGERSIVLTDGGNGQASDR